MPSEEAQLAVLAALLGEVRAQLAAERMSVQEQLAELIAEQKDTNIRLAKLESWRAFVLGVTAALSGAVGYAFHYLTGK